MGKLYVIMFVFTMIVTLVSAFIWESMTTSVFVFGVCLSITVLVLVMSKRSFKKTPGME